MDVVLGLVEVQAMRKGIELKYKKVVDIKNLNY
jgi:hypothetical protein